MTVCSIKNVEKTFITRAEKLTILKGLRLEVEEGEIITITGESGSGKSTLLHLLGGLDMVTKGTIEVAGFPVSKMGEEELSEYRKRVVGFIFQFHYLLKDFTTLENVMLPGLVDGKKTMDARERAMELLSLVNLYERREHYPLTLSGGERQRAAVARALMNDPKIILADEPTGNLDKRNSEIVEEMLFQLVQRYKKTLILVTHDRDLCGRGNRQFRLEAGELRGK